MKTFGIRPISYRERAISAQIKAEEAAAEGLRAFWLELAERYFELGDEAAPPTQLRLALVLSSKMDFKTPT